MLENDTFSNKMNIILELESIFPSVGIFAIDSPFSNIRMSQIVFHNFSTPYINKLINISCDQLISSHLSFSSINVNDN
jgi:hypothetical protein